MRNGATAPASPPASTVAILMLLYSPRARTKRYVRLRSSSSRLSAEVARGEFDPSERWDEFVRALWEQVDAGFGLTPDDQEHADIPRAWFDHADDPDVVVWDRESDEGPR